MRSARLLVVLGLVFVLAVSSFSPVAASGSITINKVTTNGDTTAIFVFDGFGGFQLVGGGSKLVSAPEFTSYTVTEEVPPGWVLLKVSCSAINNFPTTTTFTYITGGVTITYTDVDQVECTFTNSPEEAVGGVVMPANTLALVAPWIALIGLVGCVTAVAVVAKKRGK